MCVRVARGGVSCPSRASMRRQGARDLTPIGSRNRYPFRDKKNLGQSFQKGISCGGCNMYEPLPAFSVDSSR